MLKILDRYVISECWLPFSAGCGIVTGVWLGADQVRDAFKLLANANVDPTIAVWIIFLNIPQILLVTIPVGVLWATFLVFNRLSVDSELVAMRAGGISLLRIARPALLFGLIMMVVSLFIGEVVVPYAQPLAKRTEYAAAYGVPYSSEIEDFAYFERAGGKHIGQGDLKRIFHVKSVKPGTNELSAVTILDFSREELKQVYVAKSASWNADKGGWQLKDGVTYAFNPDDPADKSHTLKFDRVVIPAGKSAGELAEKLNEIRERNLLELYNSLEAHRDPINGSNLSTEFLGKWQMRFHQKIAYPFSCIMLALVGAPLGILARRSRTNWGYVQTGLLVFTFYASQSAFGSMGETGKMIPWIAAWLPNIILGCIGIIILIRKSQLPGR